MRAGLGPGACQAAVQDESRQVGQCLPSALRRRPVVVLGRRRHDGVERAAQGSAVVRGEETAQEHASGRLGERDELALGGRDVAPLVRLGVGGGGPALHEARERVCPEVARARDEVGLAALRVGVGQRLAPRLRRGGVTGEGERVVKRKLAGGGGLACATELAGERAAEADELPRADVRHPPARGQPGADRPAAVRRPPAIGLDDRNETRGEAGQAPREPVQLHELVRGVPTVERRDGELVQGVHARRHRREQLRAIHGRPPPRSNKCTNEV
ncbi:hypothetical protein [Cellulomonas edaphi]|uniref:Uncharacterized protein n=1 Tax=Cellulomonas edaphi TaxID=3053468 RepID=A0ABT7S873_9CELL|nr:hypothetical protein [Cellulomons edaphi]MDM7831826.1 hypothetical protein [Cellulomons edaphi]